MQKIKQLFGFLLSKNTLTKVILLQIIVLLFITIIGELTVNIGNSSWSGFKIDGEVDLGNSDEAFNIDNHPAGPFQISN